MSQRLADRFATCRAADRTAFVGFVTAGYPTLKDTVPALLELEHSGAEPRAYTRRGMELFKR